MLNQYNYMSTLGLVISKKINKFTPIENMLLGCSMTLVCYGNRQGSSLLAGLQVKELPSAFLLPNQIKMIKVKFILEKQNLNIRETL